MKKRAVVLYLTVIGILLLVVVGVYAAAFINRPAESVSFDGIRALADAQTQVDFGPRIPGSTGHDQAREWIRAELEHVGWVVEVQRTERLGHPIHNIIAKRSPEEPQIILGAHYDTRMYADQDSSPGMQAMPVPGANDGASGVAVLLEIARTLPEDSVPVWLVFFDAEDNGNLEGWDWILGSRAFVEEIEVRPRAAVIVDMVGDADLNIYLEKNSDKELRAEIWSAAESLGYADKFINSEKYSMLDDHTPFLEKGIPAVDIIDFDYPYWHTTQDTPDKVSAESLKAVGDTLLKWIAEQPR
ncbi:MAG: M28 family peptidase [Chloroflexi bacterium]|nr:M28 family peptidase [Chloroflexota bacterium]MCA2002730.1 M28 family peptidase [Chloroflexota bacterium]